MRTCCCVMLVLVCLILGPGITCTGVSADAPKPAVSEKMIENMTREEQNRRLGELARSINDLERRINRLDDRLQRLDNDLKEVKRKI